MDAHVGQHIFRHMIKGALWGKTVLFATHQLQVCQSFPSFLTPLRRSLVLSLLHALVLKQILVYHV